jgi:hypothetical protein
MNSVTDVIESAMLDLNENFPNTATYVLKHKPFITKVQGECEQYLLIDFTAEMTYDTKTFTRQSIELYNTMCQYFDLP